MAEVKALLDEVIEMEILNLKTLPVEDERGGDAIRDLVSLHKLCTEEIKAWADVEEESEWREMDSRQREEELVVKDADRIREEGNQARQLREQKIDRYVQTGVAAVELVLPLMSCRIWVKRGFKFEGFGVYSSIAFRNLFDRSKSAK